MQTLEIISVNLWHILISLANLLIIFLILKKFLFKPVTKMLKQRQAAVDEQYDAAEKAQREAEQQRDAYAEKMMNADREADQLLQQTAQEADRKGEKIVAAAQEKADNLLKQAQAEIELDRKKATASMREEMVTISTALAEKMLQREIRTEDHRALIASFMQEIGDGHDSDS